MLNRVEKREQNLKLLKYFNYSLEMVVVIGI